MAGDGIGRRDFLKAGIALSAGTAAASTVGCTMARSRDVTFHEAGRASNRLRGFIVSDAHFGWPSSSQPSNDRIAAAIANILRKFPDLDVFIDSGDPHHNIARDSDLEDWTDIIANGIGSIPFLFVGGNHDCQVWDHGYDPEERTMELASLSTRPYYSMDIKGVHIVCLPQLIYFSYMSEEALEWLKLDLEAAAGRTTLIISHNSLLGTTFPEDGGDTGYRVQAMSQDVYSVIDSHPNVMGWFHGHNHDYVAVLREGIPHVSNGRIGGFDPSPNRRFGNLDNLGGIFFEITPHGMRIGAYSGAEDRWLPGFVSPGKDFLEIKRPMTVDAKSPSTFCHGHGASAPGTILPIRRHVASPTNDAELRVRASKKPFVNEDVNFRVYTQRLNRNYRTKHLGGFSLEPHQGNELRDDLTWNWNNPGITLLPNHVTKRLVTYGINESQFAYLRVDPERQFELDLRLYMEVAGVVVTPTVSLWTSDKTEVARMELEDFRPQAGESVLRKTFDFKGFSLPRSIHDDPMSDRRFQLVVEVAFTNLDHIIEVHRMGIRQFESTSGSNAVHINGRQILALDKYPTEKPIVRRVALPQESRLAIRPDSTDGRLLCWHIREFAPQIQVRNATVAFREGVYHIGKPRNRFSRNHRVVIVPLPRRHMPHVSATEGVEKSGILTDQLLGSEVSIKVLKLVAREAYVEFVTAGRKGRITGGEVVESNRPDTIRVLIREPGVVKAKFV